MSTEKIKQENTTKKQSVGNAKNTNKQKSISNIESEKFELVEVKNTPFTMVREDKTWFGVMGDKRITEEYEKKEELEKELEKVNWNKIVQVIHIMNEKYEMLKNIKNK